MKSNHHFDSTLKEVKNNGTFKGDETVKDLLFYVIGKHDKFEGYVRDMFNKSIPHITENSTNIKNHVDSHKADFKRSIAMMSIIVTLVTVVVNLTIVIVQAKMNGG